MCLHANDTRVAASLISIFIEYLITKDLTRIIVLSTAYFVKTVERLIRVAGL